MADEENQPKEEGEIDQAEVSFVKNDTPEYLRVIAEESLCIADQLAFNVARLHDPGMELFMIGKISCPCRQSWMLQRWLGRALLGCWIPAGISLECDNLMKQTQVLFDDAYRQTEDTVGANALAIRDNRTSPISIWMAALYACSVTGDFRHNVMNMIEQNLASLPVDTFATIAPLVAYKSKHYVEEGEKFAADPQRQQMSQAHPAIGSGHVEFMDLMAALRSRPEWDLRQLDQHNLLTLLEHAHTETPMENSNAAGRKLYLETEIAAINRVAVAAKLAPPTAMNGPNNQRLARDMRHFLQIFTNAMLESEHKAIELEPDKGSDGDIVKRQVNWPIWTHCMKLMETDVEVGFPEQTKAVIQLLRSAFPLSKKFPQTLTSLEGLLEAFVASPKVTSVTVVNSYMEIFYTFLYVASCMEDDKVTRWWLEKDAWRFGGDVLNMIQRLRHYGEGAAGLIFANDIDLIDELLMAPYFRGVDINFFRLECPPEFMTNPDPAREKMMAASQAYNMEYMPLVMETFTKPDIATEGGGHKEAAFTFPGSEKLKSNDPTIAEREAAEKKNKKRQHQSGENPATEKFDVRNLADRTIYCDMSGCQNEDVCGHSCNEDGDSRADGLNFSGIAPAWRHRAHKL